MMVYSVYSVKSGPLKLFIWLSKLLYICLRHIETVYLEVYANVFWFFFDKMVGFLTQPFYNNLVNVSSTPLTLFIGSFQNIAYMLQTLNACSSLMVIFFYAPLFSMAGYIVSLLSVCLSILSYPYVTKIVSVRYLLKRSVYWIQILYTGI